MSKKDYTTKTLDQSKASAGASIVKAKDLRRQKAKGATLKGGISNLSVSGSPSTRPAYPHILAVGSSECKASVMSGLSGPWKATLLNMLAHPTNNHHDNMALYNITRTPGSRQIMTARLGVTRPFAAKSFSRTSFYTNPTIASVSSQVTPFDAILPTDDWLNEFSYEIGRTVKFLQFCIAVDKVYWEQHQYGGASYDPDENKANGHKFSPYERLYNELLSQMPSTQELNIPDHMAENKKLSDLATLALARLSPIADGQLADTWVFHDYHHIRQEAFAMGMDSLDFGTIVDADGNVRMMVQLPMTKLSARGDSETFNSVADQVIYDRSNVVETTEGEEHIAGQNWTTGASIGTLLYLASIGIMPDGGRPQGLADDQMWMKDVILQRREATLFTDLGLVYDGINAAQNVDLSAYQVSPSDQSFGPKTASYSPLFADTSSWILKSERDSATTTQQYYDLREIDDFSAVEDVVNDVGLSALAEGDSRNLNLEGGNPLYRRVYVVNYSEMRKMGRAAVPSMGIEEEDPEYGQKTWFMNDGENNDQPNPETFPFLDANGQPLPDGTEIWGYDVAGWSKITHEARKLTVTSKLYTKNVFEVFKYLEAVSQVLPPEYLALGLPRVTAFKLGPLSVDKPKLMNQLVDMVNRDASLRNKFNPAKNISANNGPFWKSAPANFVEKYWEAPSQSFGDHDDVLVKIRKNFQHMKFNHGAGEGALELDEVLSLMNPRIATALWTLTDTALDKRERYVPVPSGRLSANNGYMSELGDHKEGHLFNLLYSIWGSYRVDTTFPLYDIDFSTWCGTGDNEGYASVSTDSVILKGNFFNLAGANQAYVPSTVQLNSATGIRGAVGSSDFMKFRLRWNRDKIHAESHLNFRLKDEQIDGNTVQRYRLTGEVNIKPGPLASSIATRYGFPALNAKCVNAGAVADTAGLLVYPIIDISMDDENAPNADSYHVGGDAPKDGVIYAARVYDKKSLYTGRATVGHITQDQTFDDADGEVVGSFDAVLDPGADAWNAFRELLDNAGASELLGDNAVLDHEAFMAKFGVAKPRLTLLKYTTGGDLQGYSETTGAMPADGIRVTGSYVENLLAQVYSGNATYVTSAAGELYVLTISWRREANNSLGQFFDGSSIQTAEPSTPLHLMVERYIEKLFAPTALDDPIIKGFSISSGGDNDVWSEAYKIPQKENIVVNQRKHELMAAILAYSKGHYSALKLSTDGERDLYPYHGELTSFMRGLIEDIAPHTLKYHRLSVSPFQTEDIERLRVVKHIYDMADYEDGYAMMSSALGEVFTSVTSEQLISVQDVITRAGQSGY